MGMQALSCSDTELTQWYIAQKNQEHGMNKIASVE